MFKDAIERLKARNSKKAASKDNAISKSEQQGGSPDLPSLASEVTELLDDGSVSPETDKIKDWAVSKGVSEPDAQAFAEEVISAYFETPSEDQNLESKVSKSELPGETKEEGRQNTDVEIAGFQFLQKVESLVLALKSDISVLAESLEFVMDQVDKQSGLNREIQKLKSQLTEISSKPANTKTPVTQTNQIQVAKSDGIIPGNEREKFGNLILKGIEIGKCQIEDISYFETTGRLSNRALAYAKESNEVHV
ncbi:hypothetical protein [Leptospira andrefontaineae]|uniref:Uncharacterized protein n=1 Tax=Leptospira andrefontaineae TaxID=2484976 RepID=A0A4R9H6N0_9LEPT|nr:hypothetical protein [Leptospira andrefontaineae]TGK41228.1 hypothetical protein EHO65_07295 [Leptospira andrefontaineae]